MVGGWRLGEEGCPPGVLRIAIVSSHSSLYPPLGASTYTHTPLYKALGPYEGSLYTQTPRFICLAPQAPLLISVPPFIYWIFSIKRSPLPSSWCSRRYSLPSYGGSTPASSALWHRRRPPHPRFSVNTAGAAVKAKE